LGEATAHRTMELDSWRVRDPHLLDNFERRFMDLGEPVRNALETYSGNWMRDFSQVFVPLLVEGCAKIPQKPGSGFLEKEWTIVERKDKGKKERARNLKIGPLGAEKLLTAALQAFATLELGEEIGSEVVTPANIGSYKPEEHMDNPVGLPFGDLVIRDGKHYVTASKARASAKQEELASSGFDDMLQVEDSRLYDVATSGLTYFLYNTAEWSKQSFLSSLSAADEGDYRQARALFGRGMHGVEDYFGHSNFIEVALNIALRNPEDFFRNVAARTRVEKVLLDELPKDKNGLIVDTLYEKRYTPPRKRGDGTGGTDKSRRWAGGLARQSITTGTFGSLDTKISIAHTILPLIGKVFKAIDEAVDRWLLLLEDPEVSTWEQIKKKTRQNRAALAIAIIIDSGGEAKIRLPAFAWVRQKYRIFIIGERELPIGFEVRYVKPKEAIEQYKSFYRTLAETRRIIKAYSKWLNPLKRLRELVDTALERFRRWLKIAIRMVFLKIIEAITGVSIEKFARIKRIGLDQLSQLTKLGVHALLEFITKWESKTAVEVRIESSKESDAGLKRVKDRPEIVPKHKDARELPPSHSEICKDHPPRKFEDSPAPPWTYRSPFYELHLELAKEAVKHLTILMHKAWALRPHLSKTAPAHIVKNPASLLTAKRLAQLNSEAKTVAKSERKRAPSGRKFARLRIRDTDIEALLDAVDLYISHPLDAKWWRPILEKYVGNHPYQIGRDIRTRNKMRLHRQKAIERLRAR